MPRMWDEHAAAGAGGEGPGPRTHSNTGNGRAGRYRMTPVPLVVGLRRPAHHASPGPQQGQISGRGVRSAPQNISADRL